MHPLYLLQKKQIAKCDIQFCKNEIKKGLSLLSRHKDQNGGEAIPESENLAPDSGHIYARGVETCPRFRAHLCTGGQKHAPDSGHIYAQGAETCPRFRAHLCTGGRNMPQIQGRFLPTRGWLARNLRHKNTSSEWLSLLSRSTFANVGEHDSSGQGELHRDTEVLCGGGITGRR